MERSPPLPTVASAAAAKVALLPFTGAPSPMLELCCCRRNIAMSRPYCCCLTSRKSSEIEALAELIAAHGGILPRTHVDS
jgi:hypothetical protein